MNILLIAPASGPWRGIDRHRLFNGKSFRFSMLSLLTVAALSPKGAKVRLVDEQVEDVPEGDFDLVGITAMTALAPRAFELCRQFRARGIPVVMGGFHATLNPEETLRHADAIVVGPAMGAWERVCADAQAGRLQRRYDGDPEAPFPKRLPRHLLKQGRYQSTDAAVATLGCRNGCRFCSINAFHRGQRHARPVDEVAAEVADFGRGIFVFVDDNLTQDRAYALALFHALAPLRKRWVVQTSLDIADDLELLDAMAAGGCAGVFVGLETFNPEVLETENKGFNRPEHYRAAVRAFHERGIFVQAGVIVGFDHDGPEVFRETLRMLDSIGIDVIQLAVLTPLPGTPLHRAMADRIFDHDWEHYDYRHVVYTPQRMSAEVLQDGADWLIRAFYSPLRILSRVPRWFAMPGGLRRFAYPLGLNLAYLGRVWRFRIRGALPRRQRSAPRLDRVRLEKTT